MLADGVEDYDERLPGVEIETVRIGKERVSLVP
jgi:hypothetical protein